MIPITTNSVFMAVSHIPFLIGTVIWFCNRRFFGAALFFMSLVSSLAYHFCWGIVNDPEQYDQNSFCVSNPTITFVLLALDLFFANVAALHTLFWLLPHRGYFLRYRYILTLGTGLLVVTIGLSTQYYQHHSLDEAGSLWMALMVGVYFGVLYVIHVFLFVRMKQKGLLPSLRKYYAITFYSELLIFSLIFCSSGVLLWTLFQRLYPTSYFLLHPFWHILIGSSECLFGLSLRSEREEQKARQIYKNRELDLKNVAVSIEEFIHYD